MPLCLCLQYPHRGVRELGFLPERHGVYVSRWHHGSPAHRYGATSPPLRMGHVWVLLSEALTRHHSYNHNSFCLIRLRLAGLYALHFVSGASIKLVAGACMTTSPRRMIR